MVVSESTRRLAGALVMLLGALLFVAPAVAEETDKTWDAAAVTKLAGTLEETLEEIYARSQDAPVQQTALQQRERDAAQGQIRRARDLGVDYAHRIRTGWTRDESDPYFRSVVEAVDEIWETAGDAVPQESAKPLIERLRTILADLQARYDES